MAEIQHLPGRILHTLYRQIGTIHAEMDRWYGERDEDDKLASHARQLTRIKAWTEHLDLEGVYQELAQLAAAGEHDAFLTQVMGLQELITVARELWEFYRDRFELYYSPLTHYADWIEGAEWVAADAYQTALRQAKSAGANFTLDAWDSPLLQLSTPAPRAISTPVTMARGRAMMGGSQFYPTPVIVLPADLMANSWGFLSIHHEVGHDVDADLGAILFPEKPVDKQPVSEKLAENVLLAMMTGGVPQDRWQRWVVWTPEMFADFFAILSAGPAFVGHMIEALAWPRNVMFRVNAMVYPPNYLRVLLLIRFVETLESRRPGARTSRRASAEYEAMAAGYRSIWEDLYVSDKATGQSHDEYLVSAGLIPPKSEWDEKGRERYLDDWEGYLADIDTFIEAVADRPFYTAGDGQTITLRHLGAYVPRDQGRVVNAAEDLARVGGRGVVERIRPRLIPSAARLAFEQLTGADSPPDDLPAALQQLNQHALQAIEANKPSDVLVDEREEVVSHRMAERTSRLRQVIQSELASG